MVLPLPSSLKRHEIRGLVSMLDRAIRDPDEMFSWIKAMDGDPRDGAAIVNGARVSMFLDVRQRQHLYEPVSDHEAILRYLRVNVELIDLSLFRQLAHPEIAFEVFDQAFAAPEGRLEMPTASEEPRGVHAVWVIGWEEAGDRLVFCNSWGAEWGDHGTGSVSRAYLDRYLRDAWIIRDIRYGWSTFLGPMRHRATTRAEARSAWQAECPRYKVPIEHRGERLCLVLYDAISLADEVPAAVEVIELKSRLGLRLGWTHLFHLDDGESVIKELFVWPSFRRRGYGTILEDAAEQRAAKRGSGRLSIYLHAADALPTNRDAGTEFGSAAGYQWRWRDMRLPNLAATGYRTI
jgi:GNAT superfamily N-acetyltransferase